MIYTGVQSTLYQGGGGPPDPDAATGLLQTGGTHRRKLNIGRYQASILAIRQGVY